MKILFLDIDGVIKEDFQGAPFIDESLELLKLIVDKTGAKTVMISTWKVKYKAFIDNGYKTDIYDIQRLYDALCRYGLEIYDYTPYLYVDRPVRRPTEIREYLKDSENVESFCIIDDRDEFLWEELDDNLVLTYLGKDGEGKKIAHLTAEHADKAIKILNKDIEYGESNS